MKGMLSARMRRREALVTTDVSEERIAPIIRVERISEIGTTLTVTSNVVSSWLIFST
jgi:hypothetical protein